jgi:hypothetical protein
VTFQYKIITSSGIGGSGWLNGNALQTNPTGRTSNWFITDNSSAGAQPQPDKIQNSLNTRNIWLYSSDSRQGVAPFTLYVRLGFPTNCNYYLNNIVLCNVNNS